MPDRIRITDLELWTRIGVPEDERMQEQRLLVSVCLQTDLRAAAKADAPDIDYADLAAKIKVLAKTERKTVERLAEDIAALCLQGKNAESVEVTVTKFPPLGAKEVAVTIVRP